MAANHTVAPTIALFKILIVIGGLGGCLSSLDDLVGAGEEYRGDFQCGHLRSLHVNCEIEFRWLQDRQIRGLFAFESTPDI